MGNHLRGPSFDPMRAGGPLEAPLGNGIARVCGEWCGLRGTSGALSLDGGR